MLHLLQLLPGIDHYQLALHFQVNSTPKVELHVPIFPFAFVSTNSSHARRKSFHDKKSADTVGFLFETQKVDDPNLFTSQLHLISLQTSYMSLHVLININCPTDFVEVTQHWRPYIFYISSNSSLTIFIIYDFSIWYILLVFGIFSFSQIFIHISRRMTIFMLLILLVYKVV